jgi:hypothetical protein
MSERLSPDLTKRIDKFVEADIVKKKWSAVNNYNTEKTGLFAKKRPPPISEDDIRLLQTVNGSKYSIAGIKGIQRINPDEPLNPIQQYILKKNINFALNDPNPSNITPMSRFLLLKQTLDNDEAYNAIDKDMKDEMNPTTTTTPSVASASPSNTSVSNVKPLTKEEEVFIQRLKSKPDENTLRQVDAAAAAEEEQRQEEEEQRQEAERAARILASEQNAARHSDFSGPSLGQRPSDLSTGNSGFGAKLENKTDWDTFKTNIVTTNSTVLEQICKQIAIFIFWLEVIQTNTTNTFDGQQIGALTTIQRDIIRRYREYKNDIESYANLQTQPNWFSSTASETINLTSYNEQLALIVHQRQFEILEYVMSQTINSKNIQFTSAQITAIQQCIAILLCLTPDVFFGNQNYYSNTNTNVKRAKNLNGDLVYQLRQKNSNNNNNNNFEFYGATVKFLMYNDTPTVSFISEQNRDTRGIKDCFRAIEDTGILVKNNKGFAPIKALMEELGTPKQRDNSYFFKLFPEGKASDEIFKELDKLLFDPISKSMTPFTTFFTINDTETQNYLEKMKNVIKNIKPAFMTALFEYIRDERSKCSYKGFYSELGWKPKGGRKTRRQRRTKQRKHKVKGQRKTQKQRRKKTQKRRSKK